MMDDLLNSTSVIGLGAGFIWNRMMLAKAGQGGGYIISQSIRFNDDDSAYMYRTPSVAGNRKTWTWSGWVKLGNTGTTRFLYSAGVDNDDRTQIYLDGDGRISFHHTQGASITIQRLSTRLLRDPSAWYHIVVVINTPEGTASDRLKIWVNNEQVTSWQTDTITIAQNADTFTNGEYLHYISNNQVGGLYLDGYLADVHFIDGTALTASSFGEFNANGVWVPIEYVPGTVGSDVTVSYQGVTELGTDLTTYTFSGAAIGDDTTSHKVVAAFGHGNGLVTVSSCTIDGVTADVLEYAGGSGDNVSIVAADGITSTTGDIVVTFSGAQNRCSVGVWDVRNAGSLYNNFNHTGASKPLTGTIVIPTGGAVIGSSWNHTPGSNTWTWAGITEDYDVVLTEDTNNNYSGASKVFAAADSGLTVSATQSGAASASDSLAVVAFGPVTNGAYGTNGFHIDGADSAFLGLDTNAADLDASTGTFEDATVDETNLTTYTFSSHDLGASGTKKVVVCVSPNDGATPEITSVTVDGVTADLVVAAKSTAQAYDSQIFQVNTVTAATGDIVVTMPYTISAMGVTVYALLGANAEPFDTGTSTAEPGTATIQVPKGGFVIGAGSSSHSSRTHSWTGLTEDDETAINTAATRSTASKSFTSADGSFTATCTYSGSTTYAAMAVASFAPAGDNSFVSSGLTSADQMLDSPTDDAANGVGNYDILSPLINDSTMTLSNGNLDMVSASGSSTAYGSSGISSGKWYWEFTLTSGSTNELSVGVVQIHDYNTQGGTSSVYNIANTFVDYYSFGANNKHVNSATASAYGNSATYTVSDVIGVAFDMDTGAIWFSKNGVWIDGDGSDSSATVKAEIEAATTSSAASSGMTGEYHPFFSMAVSFAGGANFGQLGFTHTVPTGFKALCTANLPAPAIADGSAEFVSVVDTETNIETTLAAARSGWSSYVDLYKNRDNTETWAWQFSHDGSNEYAVSTTATRQARRSLSGSDNWVGYSFKVDGTAKIRAGSVSHTNGADTTVSYTDVGTARCVVLLFPRSNGEVPLFHPELTTGKLVYITAIDVETTDAAIKTVTSSSFKIDTGEATDTYDYLVIPEVSGFSAFTQHTGNANLDGTSVYKGFPSAITIAKEFQTSTSSWYTLDKVRDVNNPAKTTLYLDSDLGENSGTIFHDANSNGTKYRKTAAPNAAIPTISIDIAEHPFGGSGVAQARAR